MAEYAVIREGENGANLFLISFSRDSDGIWRLDDM
jgi:hypothetical protein